MVGFKADGFSYRHERRFFRSCCATADGARRRPSRRARGAEPPCRSGYRHFAKIFDHISTLLCCRTITRYTPIRCRRADGISRRHCLFLLSFLTFSLQWIFSTARLVARRCQCYCHVRRLSYFDDFALSQDGVISFGSTARMLAYGTCVSPTRFSADVSPPAALGMIYICLRPSRSF